MSISIDIVAATTRCAQLGCDALIILSLCGSL
jgi:hypothetical protein